MSGLVRRTHIGLCKDSRRKTASRARNRTAVAYSEEEDTGQEREDGETSDEEENTVEETGKENNKEGDPGRCK